MPTRWIKVDQVLLHDLLSEAKELRLSWSFHPDGPPIRGRCRMTLRLSMNMPAAPRKPTMTMSGPGAAGAVYRNSTSPPRPPNGPFVDTTPAVVFVTMDIESTNRPHLPFTSKMNSFGASTMRFLSPPLPPCYTSWWVSGPWGPGCVIVSWMASTNSPAKTSTTVTKLLFKTFGPKAFAASLSLKKVPPIPPEGPTVKSVIVASSSPLATFRWALLAMHEGAWQGPRVSLLSYQKGQEACPLGHRRQTMEILKYS
jgi:hypothetical protein